MAKVSDHDLELARQLPDNFVVTGGGSAAYRHIELVGENWVRYQIKPRAELVEALLPIVEPLLEPGVEITSRDRGVCEMIVAVWMARQ